MPRAAGPHRTHVVVEGAGSVLAVMAHPDDAELWVGGTLCLHARTSRVGILVATTDATRRAEAMAGARVLGADIEVVDRHSVTACQHHLRAFRPDVVVTHRFDDVHPEHRCTADIVLASLPDVVIATGHPSRLYTCDSYESLTLTGAVQGRVIVDVTATFETKMTALAAHASQPFEHFGGMARRLGALWGARIGESWAEAFDPVPVLGRVPAARHL